jgi:bifunctional DNA-binding transcriptional regulator/antitoxin component of YhaV-PrlF toxin-antitoxin module
MSNISNRVKFNRIDSMIWKKSYVDYKGRAVLPQKLRQKLGLNSNSVVLWISAKHKEGRDNEFILEVGVKK